MKKNWVLRLGLLAMVLTLVTMPMVSSTYAKYVTADNGTAEARVAKWGVEIETDFSELFGDAYAVTSNDILLQTDATNLKAATLSVVAATPEDLVLAPGTEGSFAFSITGTPEVAVNLEVVADIDMDGWDVVDANDYHPILFTLTDGYGYWDGEDWLSGSSVNITAAELEEGLLGLSDSTIDANVDLATITTDDGTGDYVVTWVWPFFVDANADSNSDFITTLVKNATGPVYYTYDEADTKVAELGTPTLTITLNITATQIN